MRPIVGAGITRSRLAAAVAAFLAVAGSVVLATPAHAATCRTWEPASDWGKAWICVDYRLDQWGRQDAYHVFGEIMDTKTDTYCVTLYAHQGVQDSTQLDQWSPSACTLNKAVSFSLTEKAGPGPFCGARLVRGTSSRWVNFQTLWQSPYGTCAVGW